MSHGEVDYDRAWLRLKAEITKNRSHGQDQLLAAMGRIEVECADEAPAPAGALAEGPLSDEAGGDAPSSDMAQSVESTTATGGDYERSNRSNREPVHH